MAYLSEKKFDFRSHALPADKFGVVHFKGFEGFSTPYEFEIMLVSNDPDIDLTDVLQNPAVFTIVRPDGDIPFHGILTSFELLHAIDEHVLYRAKLVPKFWWLSLTRHNQVFLDKTVPEIIEEVLQDGGLTTNDYEFRVQSAYPQWEFVCQYRESHLNFVSRWMEREGMYYFFEQTKNGEKLIITDTHMSHTPMAEGKTMFYSPPSGLDAAHREEVIGAIVCKQKLLPGRLRLDDYNYRKPSLALSAEAEISSKGRGMVHIYGEHFRTPQEGSALAKIRAEELLSHEKRFHGESTIPYLRPGYLFDLKDHFRETFNHRYLTIELAHEGSQAAYLLAGIQQGLAEFEKQPYYRNSFVAVPGDVQYRHPKTTEKPYFYGTINARVDAEGGGKFAELDDQGRYKVKLPFDISGRQPGHASHWMRMAQPYAGENQGMHFPLHKHAEVLLTFVEGDPDRPIIAGALPNPESPSPISSENQTKSIINTGEGPQTRSVGAEYVFSWPRGQRPSGNYIEFEDQSGGQPEKHILVYSPTKESWIRLGHPGNDPESSPDDGIKLATNGLLIEHSKDHQRVELVPQTSYENIRDFELTDEVYASINRDLQKESEHIGENIRILDIFLGTLTNSGDSDTKITDPEGELVEETNQDVRAKYNLEKTSLNTTKTAIDGFNNTANIESQLADLTGSQTTKSDFISGVEGKTFDPDERANTIIISVILRNTFNKHAKHRLTEVSGDQINKTTGTHKITAINDERRIEMTDQGIYIDAGEDRDVTIKCKNFFLKNKDEDNITYGGDYAVHYGPNDEEFYGTSTETFFGKKKEEMHGKATENFWGNKHEEHHGDIYEKHYGLKEETHHGRSHSYFLGGAMEYSWAGKFSIDAGESLEISGFPFKQEIIISLLLELFLGMKWSFHLGSAVEAFVGPSSEIRVGPKVEYQTSEAKTNVYKFWQTVGTFASGGIWHSSNAVKFEV